MDFETVVDDHGEDIQRLLPDDEGLDTQRPALEAWYEQLEPDDIVWCIGDAAGAYGLLAAERLGPSRIVVFEPDRSRVPSVEDAFVANGHGDVTVEPVSFLGWQRHGVSSEGVVDAYSDDPFGDVVAAIETPGRPSTLLLDVPGYGGGLLSTLSAGQQQCVESVLLKTTDTLAQSQLEHAGFETTPVAERDGVRPPWRRALLASRDGDDEVQAHDGPAGGDETDGSDRRSLFTAPGSTREESQLRWAVSRPVVAVLVALAAFFNGLAVVLGAIARIPGIKHTTGRIFVGLIVAFLFVLFLVVGFVLVELGQVVGASEQSAGAAAGALVLAIPVLGALFFLKLAIEG